MEVLLPIAFSALSADMLEPLVRLSEYFRNICSSVLHEDQLMEMPQQIVIILCKLETIFPPGFWNVMEHLPVYLAQEAYLGGPVHYRWMYSFERFLKWLKQKAKNKSKLESSMAIAYLICEIQTFGFDYFDTNLLSTNSTIRRNKVSYKHGPPTTFIVFQMKGTPFGKCHKSYLTQVEYNAAHLHILLNCNEVQSYLQ